MKLTKTIGMENGADLEVELNKPSNKSCVLMTLYVWNHGEKVILYRGPLGINSSPMEKTNNPFFKAIGKLLTSVLEVLPAFEVNYQDWNVKEP